MTEKKQIFEFNHIDRSSSTERKQEVINLMHFIISNVTFIKKCIITSRRWI